LLWDQSSSTGRAVSAKGALGSVGDFEKMLYDNAQLAHAYLHAWRVTGEPFYRTIVEEMLDDVVREMASPEGGFCSTQDADSESEEANWTMRWPTHARCRSSATWRRRTLGPCSTRVPPVIVPTRSSRSESPGLSL
jgi:hypothetical protein